MENRRPQWSELRAELLELVLEKHDLADHARFASVCSSWRSVAIHNPPINKPLYSALSHDPYHLVRQFITSLIPSWRTAQFIGAGLDGWLVITIDGRDLFLLNKGSNSIIPLPPPPSATKYIFLEMGECKAVLSSPPLSSTSSSSSGECTVVLFDLYDGLGGVFYCRLGSDKSFTKLSDIPYKAEDILFYKEQLYVLCFPKTIVIFDLPLNNVSRSHRVTHSIIYPAPTPWRLLILGNDVLSIIAGDPSQYSVFTLDGTEPRVVPVNNIDDNFLLLSNRYCSLSITTKDHKEFRRASGSSKFRFISSTIVLDTSEDSNKAKADDPWPLFFVMFSNHGIENL